MQKQDKFGSKVFNPPSIIDQMKDKGLFFNNPVAAVNAETRFKP